ncbi:MAG: hypothetical protein JO102_02785, partial [Elusimicrobia bacterium]|nr:hypothetical protein [Elusimicrobiota bacterium]
GARRFAEGLFDFCYGASALDRRFGRWVEAVAGLPRRQTRVLTWPVLTIFPFIALPEEHFFLKPNVTRIAFSRYGLAFDYASKPAWPTYASLLAGAARVATDLRRLNPRDMMDIQGFLWVQGSQEYPDE